MTRVKSISTKGPLYAQFVIRCFRKYRNEEGESIAYIAIKHALVQKTDEFLRELLRLGLSMYEVNFSGELAVE